MLILEKDLLEPGRAGREDGLVSLDGPPVDRQGHVAQRLATQELVERLSQLLGVVDPGQAQVLHVLHASAGEVDDAQGKKVSFSVTVRWYT